MVATATDAGHLLFGLVAIVIVLVARAVFCRAQSGGGGRGVLTAFVYAAGCFETAVGLLSMRLSYHAYKTSS